MAHFLLEQTQLVAEVGALEFRNFSGDGGAVMAGVGGAASGGLGS